MNVTHRRITGPFWVYVDGNRVGMERDETTVIDMRETTVGLVDFGYVTYGPWIVKCDDPAIRKLAEDALA